MTLNALKFERKEEKKHHPRVLFRIVEVDSGRQPRLPAGHRCEGPSSGKCACYPAKPARARSRERRRRSCKNICAGTGTGGGAGPRASHEATGALGSPGRCRGQDSVNRRSKQWPRWPFSVINVCAECNRVRPAIFL